MAQIENVWADGFGRWMVTVKVREGEPVESSGASILARKAIRQEIMERAAQGVRLAPVHVERAAHLDYITPQGETIVYFRER